MLDLEPGAIEPWGRALRTSLKPEPKLCVLTPFTSQCTQYGTIGIEMPLQTFALQKNKSWPLCSRFKRDQSDSNFDRRGISFRSKMTEIDFLDFRKVIISKFCCFFLLRLFLKSHAIQKWDKQIGQTNKGASWSTAVGRTPHKHEVKGSNPADYWAFIFSLIFIVECP